MATLADLLPDELKHEPMFKDIPDVATLAKVARDAMAYRGGSIRIPEAGADAALQKEFQDKLAAARPDLAPPKDEAAYTADIGDAPVDLAALRTEAKESGLTVAQFQKRVALEAAKAKAQVATVKSAEAALRAEWGDGYADKARAAKAAAVAMGVPQAAAEQMPPAQLRVWGQTAARLTGPGGQMREQGTGAPTGKTRDEAMARARAIREDPKYWDNRHPELGRELIELERVLAGE